MWEPGSNISWTIEGPSVPLGSCRTLTHQIHVLLVDHNKESLASTARMLELYTYKVTAVESGSAALLMLSDREDQFDLVLADIGLPDIDGFRVLQEAVERELPAILMSADEDAMVAKIALENGACFFLDKPLGTNVLKSLWQYVTKAMIDKVKKFEEQNNLHETTNKNGKFNESMETISEEKNETGTNSKKNKDGTKKKVRSGKGINVDEVVEFDNKDKNKSANKKACTEWTEELHSKFMAAVNQLGEGRCYPKEILDLMNVPGLTRMQVASHLQKCRNDNWRAPEVRRTNASSVPTHSTKHGSRKFGLMPRLVKSSSYTPMSHLQETRGNYTAPGLYSSLGNSFLGNREGDYTVQLIHSQAPMVPNCYVGNLPTHDSGMQSMGQIGASGTQAWDKNLATLSDMTSNQNSEPVLSDFSNAALGAGSHSSSSNQIPVLDDYLNFLPEMGDSQGISKLLGGSSLI